MEDAGPVKVGICVDALSFVIPARVDDEAIICVNVSRLVRWDFTCGVLGEFTSLCRRHDSLIQGPRWVCVWYVAADGSDADDGS